MFVVVFQKRKSQSTHDIGRRPFSRPSSLDLVPNRT